jgi:hypothetical protein
MTRRPVAALLAVAGLGLVGCRPDTVRLGFEPEPGATYRYRYEIEADVTRQVEGEEPRTTHVQMTFESEQTVVEEAEGGTLMEVTLTTAGAPPRTARVVIDRAGSLEAFQEVDGLPADAVGLPTGALLASAATEPPDRPLSIGDDWDVNEGTVSGDGHLDRLGVLDGEPAAVVEATIIEVLAETTERLGSAVELDGDLRSVTTTAFDVGDGSVRRSLTDSEGTVDVLVSPPADVQAAAVAALVTYELEVTTTRLD